MHITRFSRIDTVSWPGEYLSVVRLSDGEGDGENIAEIANIIRGDKDSIDAVVLVPEGGDIESIPGIHRIIREFRPPTTHLIVVTSGSDPRALDDLIGAGYVDRVAFRFGEVPDSTRQRSIEVALRQGVRVSVCPVLDRTRMTSEDVLRIADMSAGHSEFVLLTPSDPNRCFKKKDLNALVKSLKGHARNVRVLEDVRMT